MHEGGIGTQFQEEAPADARRGGEATRGEAGQAMADVDTDVAAAACLVIRLFKRKGPWFRPWVENRKVPEFSDLAPGYRLYARLYTYATLCPPL